LKRFNTLLSVLVFIFFISSCATQKSKDDPSKIGKFYHDVTSKYNGYFNANELLEQSMTSLNEQHQDNYNKILSVYKYSATDNASSVASDLDNAIKKVSIVASLHPASHWKDDCYLLMAKSQYVKKDYESAEETLEFMVDEYDPKNADKKRKKGKKKKKSKKQKKKEAKEKKKKREATKKDKKKAQEKKRKEKEAARKKRIKESKKKAKQNKKNRKKGKKSSSKKKTTKKKEPEVKTPEKVVEVKEEKKEEKKKDKKDSENYFLKHKPAFQEGVLWLARTYIERDKFDQASRLIDRLKKDPKTFSEIKRDLAPVEADFYLKQKKYAQAIAPLEQAIDLTKSKGDKARYAYIIAQLNQKLGQGEAAYAYFEKAKKYSRDYEMRFSSQLNMETNAWLNGKATADQTIARLNKMLKNDKNEEYQDQIHYALANIYLKTGETKEAIANLQLSLNKSETNPAQKAESYLLLAQLFYQDENYVSSKSYYDSTLLVMAKADDRYFEAQKYATSLTEIAANIQIIELQDSLLRISTMSDDEKRKIAAKIKKEEAALAARNKPTARPNNKRGGARPNIRPGRGNQFQEPSTWVFYDDKKVKKGKRSFERRWGNRKLEDDWRRSNRRGAGQVDDVIEEAVVEEGSDLSDEEIAKFLSDVPSTPEEVAEVKGKIKDALYELGTLYRDRLENHQKSVETLGKLEKDFPGNNHELNAWYYQYLSYTDLTQQPTAKIYKDKIIGKFPESTYAKVLNGEAVAFEDAEAKLNNYYKDTYSDFVNLEYQRAFDKVGKVKELFGEGNTLQPKFALLSSMCIGNLKGKGEYVKSLKEVVAKFPKTPEQTRAKEILRLLGELKEDPAIPKEGNAGGKFKLQDKKVHYMIVVLKGGKIELSDAKIKVSNYNREFHKTDKLRISNIYLGADTNTPILVIRRFKNKEKAMTYHQGIMANKKKFLGENNDYEVFAVTQHNYREILKAKSIEGYREFFDINYK